MCFLIPEATPANSLRFTLRLLSDVLTQKRSKGNINFIQAVIFLRFFYCKPENIE